MPADDLVLNVRQIAQYTPASSAPTTATLLMQLAGIGSAYASISPAALVGTALAQGGGMQIGGLLEVASVQGGSAQFNNGAFGVLGAQTARIVDFDATFASISGLPIATQAYADSVVAALRAATVWTVNGRSGNITLTVLDVAGAAPIYSPRFQGTPRAPTPCPESCSDRLATTAFVHGATVQYIDNLLREHPFVFTFNGRTGDIVLTEQDIINAGGGDVFDSPVFTGIPTAPTAAPATNTQQLATTAFVMNAVANIDLSNYAPLDSPAFSGYVTGPTAPVGTSDGQLATTAFVMNAVADSVTGVASFNTRTGNVTLQTSDITAAGGAVLSSPAFTGVPTAPTAAPGVNTTQLATTAFVEAAIAAGGVSSFNGRQGAVVLTTADVTGVGGAPITSPAFTGTPTAPTAGSGNNSTQLATTAFVANTLASIGSIVSSFNGRTGVVSLQANDISAAGGAVLASPAFSGTPTAPTATAGNSSSQLATTAFVANAVAAGGGVSSFNGRTGAIVLLSADITGAGGAPVASPVFTGTPAAPTAAPGTSTTQLATTAFVEAAIATGSGVTSFNSRTGAVTLAAADITGAGGAVLASPAFTGTPTAPTAASNTNTQQLATTAFVQNVVNTIGAGVASFNGRTGIVTLMANDVSAAGGAVLASPAFTGTPTAPTPATADSSTTLATTAFVKAAIGGPYLLLTGGTLTGPLVISPATGAAALNLTANAASAFATINLTKVANGGSQISAYINAPAVANTRWNLALADASAESGSNAGSNFVLTRYADGGTALGTALGINRASGVATFGSTGIVYGSLNASSIGWRYGSTTGVVACELFVNGGLTGPVPFGIGTAPYTAPTSWGFNGTTSTMVANYNGGSIQWPISFVSDPRLKLNVAEPAQDALAAINALHVYEFDMTPPLPHAVNQHWNWGLMADEALEAAIPYSLIPPIDDKSYAAIRDMPIVIALVRAVQQLTERLTALEARMA